MDAPRIILSASRRRHFLDGDATGGGHGPGRGIAGKSTFPAFLSDDQICQGVLHIANDPRSYEQAIIPRSGSRVRARGMIGDTMTIVIVDPVGGEIITAWPQQKFASGSE